MDLVDYKTLIVRYFVFPLKSESGRKEIAVGGVLFMVLLPIGWILNLGSRLNTVKRYHNNESPIFTALKPYSDSFRRGAIAAFWILAHLSPSFLLLVAAYWLDELHIVQRVVFCTSSLFLFIVAIFLLPAGMTAYAVENRLDYLKDPKLCFQKAMERKRQYFFSWICAILAILISLMCTVFFVIGFFIASVWAWHVVGFVFTDAFYKEGFFD